MIQRFICHIIMDFGYSKYYQSQCLAEEIIMFDKSATIHNDVSSNFPLIEQDIIASGDSYFYNFLNSKVKLTELGLYILDTLRGEVDKIRAPPGGTGGLQSL